MWMSWKWARRVLFKSGCNHTCPNNHQLCHERKQTFTAKHFIFSRNTSVQVRNTKPLTLDALGIYSLSRSIHASFAVLVTEDGKQGKLLCDVHKRKERKHDKDNSSFVYRVLEQVDWRNFNACSTELFKQTEAYLAGIDLFQQCKMLNWAHFPPHLKGGVGGFNPCNPSCFFQTSFVFVLKNKHWCFVSICDPLLSIIQKCVDLSVVYYCMLHALFYVKQ